jgi:hypothetical protein
MRKLVGMVLILSGCSEFGFGNAIDAPGGPGGDGGSTADGGGGPGGNGGNGGNGSAGVPEAEPPFPGEPVPPGWTDFDHSCETAGIGPISPQVDDYTITDPIDSLTAMLTTGNVQVIPRAGPVEVEVTGVAADQAHAATVSNGTLTLDYIGSVGNLKIWAPPDLLDWNLRVCVGNLSFDQLGGTVASEVRVGNIDGTRLTSDTLFGHNGRGNVNVHFDDAPSSIFLDGGIGNHVARVPIDDCDCDLDVGVGTTDLQGIAEDPGAATSIWARRNTGNITVSQ